MPLPLCCLPLSSVPLLAGLCPAHPPQPRAPPSPAYPHPPQEISIPPGSARLRGLQSLELSLTDSQVLVGGAAGPPVQEECGDRGRGDCCPAAHPAAGPRVGLARPPAAPAQPRPAPTEHSRSETLTGCCSSSRLSKPPGGWGFLLLHPRDGTDQAAQTLPAPPAPSRIPQAAPYTQIHPPGGPEESPSYRAPWGFARNLSCISPPNPRLRSGGKWRSCWWEQAGR